MTPPGRDCSLVLLQISSPHIADIRVLMPTAPVNDRGAVLYYDDTGAPEGCEDYLTIVLVHGVTFHGAIFRRTLPYATSRSLRIVRLNLRDYPGSSPYTPEELAAFTSSDVAAQTAATRAHGEELAAFLEYFVKEQAIPGIRVAGGQTKGGLALVTWSMSNIHTFSFLGNAQLLPPERRDFLTGYLRKVVLYDPANSSLGLPPSEGLYSPWRDPTLTTIKARGDVFTPWVSSYFEKAPDLSDVTASLLAARRIIQNEPSVDGTPDLSKTPTVLRMSPEEFESVVDRGVLERSSFRLFSVSRDILNANFRRALVDTGGVWPDVKVLLVWCDQSMHDCVRAAKVISELARQPPQDGSVRRDIDIVRVEGANHFPHWETPEAFLELLVPNV